MDRHCSTAFGRIDCIAHMADGVNQWGISDFFPQPSNENFDELGVVFMGVFPDAFA